MTRASGTSPAARPAVSEGTDPTSPATSTPNNEITPTTVTAITVVVERSSSAVRNAIRLSMVHSPFPDCGEP